MKKQLPDRCQGNKSQETTGLPDKDFKKSHGEVESCNVIKDWMSKRKKEGRGGEGKRGERERRRGRGKRETLNRDELDLNWRTKEMKEDH